jgi:hypothetical protein
VAATRRARPKADGDEFVAATGEPIGRFPNWDAKRGALRMHSDREAGSSYDDLAQSKDAAHEASARQRRRRQSHKT